jgi:hypothetical protein
MPVHFTEIFRRFPRFFHRTFHDRFINHNHPSIWRHVTYEVEKGPLNTLGNKKKHQEMWKWNGDMYQVSSVFKLSLPRALLNIRKHGES